MGNKNNKGNGQGNGQGNGNNKAQKVVFYPCKTSVLKEERNVGGNPNKLRMWKGLLDISSVTHAEKVIVTMIFNYPLNFQLVSPFFIS